MNPFNYVSEYIKGELSVEQQAIFEAALADNKDLQLSVQEQRSLHRTAQSMDTDLRAFVTAQQKQVAPEKVNSAMPSMSKIKRWLFFGLLLIICIGIVLVSYMAGEDKKSEDKINSPQESIFGPIEKDSITIPVDTVTNQIGPSSPSKTPSTSPIRSEERSNSKAPKTSIEKDKHRICIAFANDAGEKLLEELSPRVMGSNKTSALILKNKEAVLDSLIAKNDQLTNLEKISLGYLLFSNKEYSKALEYIEDVCQQNTLYKVDANYLKFTIMAASLPQNDPKLKKQFGVVLTYGGQYAEQATELLKQLY